MTTQKCNEVNHANIEGLTVMDIRRISRAVGFSEFAKGIQVSPLVSIEDEPSFIFYYQLMD